MSGAASRLVDIVFTTGANHNGATFGAPAKLGEIVEVEGEFRTRVLQRR